MKNIHTVAKAVLFNDDKVLIVRRSKTDPRRPLEWDLPGGIVEDNEAFNDACAREIDEEVGIKIDPNRLHLAHTQTESVKDNESTSWLIYVGRTSTKEVKLSYEHDKYQWVSLDEAIKLNYYERQLRALKHIRRNNLVP